MSVSRNLGIVSGVSAHRRIQIATYDPNLVSACGGEGREHNGKEKNKHINKEQPEPETAMKIEGSRLTRLDQALFPAAPWKTHEGVCR